MGAVGNYEVIETTVQTFQNVNPYGTYTTPDGKKVLSGHLVRVVDSNFTNTSFRSYPSLDGTQFTIESNSESTFLIRVVVASMGC